MLTEVLFLRPPLQPSATWPGRVAACPCQSPQSLRETSWAKKQAAAAATLGAARQALAAAVQQRRLRTKLNQRAPPQTRQQLKELRPTPRAASPRGAISLFQSPRCLQEKNPVLQAAWTVAAMQRLVAKSAQQRQAEAAEAATKATLLAPRLALVLPPSTLTLRTAMPATAVHRERAAQVQAASLSAACSCQNSQCQRGTTFPPQGSSEGARAPQPKPRRGRESTT